MYLEIPLHINLAKLLLNASFSPRHLIVEARNRSLSVGLLDPDPLSVDRIPKHRQSSVDYLEVGLRKYADKNFMMFAHNLGRHFVAVIIALRWKKVMYLDSLRVKALRFGSLTSVIDE